MAEKIKLKVSPSVARFVRPGVTVDEKLSGIAGAGLLELSDRIVLLFCLIRDTESIVSTAAVRALEAQPDEVLMEYIHSSEAHPSVLVVLASALHARTVIAEALLAHELLSDQAREFLLRQAISQAGTTEYPAPDEGAAETAHPLPPDDLSEVDEELLPDEDELPEEEVVEEIDEKSEQFLSKYKMAQIMGISEKIKMALSGDKEWRAILVKDANKLVSGGVIKNPRLSDGEVLQFLKLGVQNDEIVRLICANREWIKNYNIRKALINCPKTPLANSLRYLGTMNEKDVAGYAKSKNVASVISTQAKRMLMAKKR